MLNRVLFNIACGVWLWTYTANWLCAQSLESELLFVRRVAPLLQTKCIACHGGTVSTSGAASDGDSANPADSAEIEGGLDLRTAVSTLRGGESETPAIVVGKADESPLYLAATRTHATWSAMPPKEAERLTDEQLRWLREWIDGGADWPAAERVAELAKTHAAAWSVEDGVMVATSGGLSADWTNRTYQREGLWAYQPLRTSADLQIADTPQHPIDQLIERRLPDGLQNAPRADRRTLVRRATLDLTGLPPSIDEVNAFVADGRSDEVVFAELIERLLASPHYGEQMAQHWLDVVRYADSSGFANDYERGSAWRYRDYVVRSFNDDKPYRDFIREQIAGDEIDPTNPEMLIATGFLRMGPWELTGMEVAKVARQRFLDDVTNSVGETFLAHSLQCARCHDHKFDPIPTRDYYAIQAVFATTQLAERPAGFLQQENTRGFDEKRYLEKRRDEYLATLAELDQVLLENAQQWYRERELSADAWNAAVAEVLAGRDGERKQGRARVDNVFNAARGLMTKQNIPEEQFPPKLVGFTPQQFGHERVARKGLERLAWELERYEPFALCVYNGRTPQMKSVYAPLRVPQNRLQDGELELSCILTGGDPFATGERVYPSVLSVIRDFKLRSDVDATNAVKASSAMEKATEQDEQIEGRRLALADWIADPANPLTARVIVNRVWMWHFNEPLAGNPNNFGSTGKRPTHPELLDWLAAKFIEDGGSFKQLHRRIMTSDAYCRSAECAKPADRKKLEELDPLGESYAVFKLRRLTAEELRDAMLCASKELNRTLGGIPNRPEINLEAALQPRQVMGTFAAAWTPNPLPEQRHRRSLYSLKLRGLMDPQLEVFNAPTPDFSCERREASSVTPQVFSLFNGQSTHARALAIAKLAMESDSQSLDASIAKCFATILARDAADDELSACVEHWNKVKASLAQQHFERVSQPLEVQREAVEENTGERFSFSEQLYSNADFVSDLQAADVDAATLALADICLVLLNSNEFAFVY